MGREEWESVLNKYPKGNWSINQCACRIFTWMNWIVLFFFFCLSLSGCKFCLGDFKAATCLYTFLLQGALFFSWLLSFSSPPSSHVMMMHDFSCCESTLYVNAIQSYPRWSISTQRFHRIFQPWSLVRFRSVKIRSKTFSLSSKRLSSIQTTERLLFRIDRVKKQGKEKEKSFLFFFYSKYKRE